MKPEAGAVGAVGAVGAEQIQPFRCCRGRGVVLII